MILPKRLVKRHANLCVSFASVWLVFSFLVAALKNASPNMSWESPIAIWGIQLLLIAGAIYFYKTETPSITHWVGDVHGHASTVVSNKHLPEILHELALLVPELTDMNIQKIMTELQKRSDGNGVTIPIEFYNRPDKFQIYSSDDERCVEEDFEKDKIGLFVSTHVDLANLTQTIFDYYSDLSP